MIKNNKVKTNSRFKRPFTKLSLLALSVGGLTNAASTIAQNAQPVLDEVVITAQKRAQSAQDVGISITTMSGENLRDQGITQVEDLTDSVPGIGIYDVSGGVPVVIIRGVGLQNFRVNDTPTTSFYIDEVYQTSVAMAGFTMFDLDRVEVLKGPQGGLYGRNAVGGAIQVISAKPSLDEANGYISLGAGKYNRFTAEGAVGGPLSDNVAARLSGRIVQSDDTYFHSTTGNFDHGEEDKWALRGQLLFTPSETSEILLKVHGGEDSSETPLIRPVGIYQRFGLNLVPGFADGALFNYGGMAPSITSICSEAISAGNRDANCETSDGQTPNEHGIYDIHDSASDIKPHLDNSWNGISINASFDIGALTLTSISAYDTFNHTRIVDFDGLPSTQQHLDYNSEFEVLSQEFRLSNDASESVRWMLGLNYAEDTLDEDTSLVGTSGLLPLAFSGFTQAEQDYEQDTKMASAYGHVDFDLGDNTVVTVEGRYTKEDKSFIGGVSIEPIGLIISYIDDQSDYSAFSGKIGVEHRLSEETLLYANISKGFKSGGYFGGFATDNSQLEAFDQETIVAYEMGFKTDLMENRFRLNGAVFYYNRYDVQLNGTDVSAVVPISRLTNAGDSRNYGAELESTFLLGNNFKIDFGLSYIDSEITDSDLVVGDIFAVGIHTAEGRRPPNTPEYNANLIVRYDQELGDSLLTNIQLEYNYRTKQDLSSISLKEERGFLEEDGYGLTNLRAGLGSIDGKWDVGFAIENLLDTEYRTTAGSNTLAGFYEIYGAPRTWSVSASYNF